MSFPDMWKSISDFPDTMKAVSAQTMRALDAETIRSGAVDGFHLMLRAGDAAFREIIRSFPNAGKYLVLAGKGNNGGDGSVVAARLAGSGRCVEVFLTCDPAELSGDALSAFRLIPDSVPVHRELTPDLFDPDRLIIDALLGTGFSGSPREPAASWIRLINNSDLPVVSLDLPSGLNADDGSTPGEAVHADMTVTFELPKAGLFLKNGPALSGRLRVPKIGIPAALTDAAETIFTVAGPEDALPFLRREPFDAYKNQRGHILIAGGSADYSGAPFLAGEAALRTGAGLVSLAVPDCARSGGSLPHALMIRRFASSNGYFPSAPSDLDNLTKLLEKADSAVFGPGLGAAPSVDPILALALKREKPLILDADALNRISASPDLREKLLARKPGSAILTPHKGEMARLLSAFGQTASEKNEHDACLLARLTGALVVAKGPHTVVAAPDGFFTRNLSGCTALATAGSGDVLSGMIAALTASSVVRSGKATLRQAVAAAVYLHGLAGELCAPVPCSGRGTVADDLIRMIPAALRSVSPFA